MNRVTYLVAAFGLTLAGCGDSANSPSGPAPARNDPGTGTQTMMVTADFEGKDVPGGFVTDFEVQLREAAGDPISGATVTVRNANLGTLNLLEDGAGSGDYTATVNTFAAGDYELNVTRGLDNVRGVVVGGMAAHSILSPQANDTLLAAQSMMVTWNRPSQAAAADVETQDFAAEGIADAGSFSIAAVDNPPRPDQRIRVWRFNRVDIAGGLFGSRLKLKIRNTVEPVVVQ